jgi:hypothetical protein
MNAAFELITVLLTIAAAAQLAIAILNLFLARILRWHDDLGRISLLLREVFWVHSWFISVTLTIFAVVTFRFAGEMAMNPMGRWLAAGIGGFWALRTILQIAYYSSAHWRGNKARTVIHIVLLGLYGGMAATYLLVPLRAGGL